MKKNLIPLSLIFSLMIAPTASSAAETLKSMANRSTVILALSENNDLAKQCHVNTEKISELSQKLKSKVDQKISKLGDGDINAIKNRISTCELDCSCTIYAMAFSNLGHNDVTLERKAATETAKDRRRCVKNWKDFCQLIKF